MRYPGKLVIGSIALSLALGVGAATSDKETVKSKASSTMKQSAVSDAPPITVPSESVRTDIAPIPGIISTQVPATDTPDAAAAPTKSKHLVVRGRLDDGRYQGFRQHANEEIRIGSPVQAEIDRLYRGQPPAK